MSPLRIKFQYDIKNDSVTFDPETNIKPHLIGDTISDYIQTQLGAGSDPTPAKERDVYTICLDLDVSTDTYTLHHDCGNLGLVLGILLEVARKQATDS